MRSWLLALAMVAGGTLLIRDALMLVDMIPTASAKSQDCMTTAGSIAPLTVGTNLYLSDILDGLTEEQAGAVIANIQRWETRGR